VAIELYRIDDRLVHGQVVVGWGQPLDVSFVVLVDDVIATSEWEQELYRMGAPPEMTVLFESVDSALAHLAEYQTRPAHGILLAGDVETMRRLVERAGTIRTVNLGGIHHRSGRIARMRYVFLTPEEEQSLRELAASGVTISAQDVPAAAPVPLEDVLAGTGEL
jgi:PTS system mannose-specific IIB component/fructoselysine and glucoselysine-specific PTS system IIB component